jgi:hypothetical protein
MNKSEEALAFSYLEKIGSPLIRHSGRTLFDHLVGTFRILRSWNAADSLAMAGLFHSVYGTESFGASTISYGDRQDLAEQIGATAERLVWLFGTMTPESFWRCFKLLTRSYDIESFPLQNRITRAELPCCRDDFVDLLNLTLANALEQAKCLPMRYGQEKQTVLKCLVPFALPAAAASFEDVFGADQH